jgi:hypothetical protein
MKGLCYYISRYLLIIILNKSLINESIFCLTEQIGPKNTFAQLE